MENAMDSETSSQTLTDYLLTGQLAHHVQGQLTEISDGFTREEG